MRNPDRTYTTLRDRAEYLLADQIKSMNYHRKHSKTAIDTHLRQTHINQMSRLKSTNPMNTTSGLKPDKTLLRG